MQQQQQQHQHSSLPSLSAVAELQHFLSTPPQNNNNNNGSSGSNISTSAAITIAHANLQALRDTGDVHFLFTRSLIELANNNINTAHHQQHQQHQRQHQQQQQQEELLFHCITGCRHVILTKWNSFSTVFQRGIRDYLFVLGCHCCNNSNNNINTGGNNNNNNTMSRTIQRTYFNAAASFWKRSWVEDLTHQSSSSESSSSASVSSPPVSAQEQSLLDQMRMTVAAAAATGGGGGGGSMPQFESPPQLFSYLQQQMTLQHSQQQQDYLQQQRMEAAASFLIVLLGEFAGGASGKASHYHLPLEFHKRAHLAFEQGALRAVTTTMPTTAAAAAAASFVPLQQCLQMSMTALSQLVPTLLLVPGAAPQQQEDTNTNTVALSIVQLTIEVIGWEWGTDSWDVAATTTTSSSGIMASGGGRALVRPPASWRDILLQPEFVRAIFQIHQTQQQVQLQLQSSISASTTSRSSLESLLHGLRQLLLLLTSLTGPMFQNTEERKQFGSLLLEGILGLLQLPSMAHPAADDNDGNGDVNDDTTLLVDSLSMISRLFVNYKMSLLADLPQLPLLLQGVANLGRQLLHDNLRELQQVAGDLDLMQHREWREEALALMVEGLVLLCGDPWLLYSGSEDFRMRAKAALAQTLGPLYVDFVTCRTQMARLEEMYYTAEETDLDEVREEIFAVDLEEEMTALANVGRLDLASSLGCLANLFQQLVPQLQQLWNGHVGVVTPQAAGLLEESRLVTMYVGHLLTDDNEGETPVIPDTILAACQKEHNGEVVTQAIVGAVQTLHQFAHFQATKIAQHPADPRLSPLLAKEFLWFLHRWAPAYILPVDYGASGDADSSSSSQSIVKTWASPEAVQESVSFVITLCLHYHCYWPQERQVQENASLLLHAMAKRCRQMRLAMIATPSFRQLISYHCLTSGIRHSAPPAEFESTIRAKVTGQQHHHHNHQNLSMDMLRGYQRLPYDIKSKILTALLVGCSEPEDPISKSLFNDCLSAIHEAFSSLVHALSTKQTAPGNVDAKEMAALCVELYGGVARAGEMVAAERISNFLTPALPHLSGLMSFYADDLSICESLLRLFRDYAEQFIAVLDPESCLVLFQASGDLLKSYSAVHCASTRVIVHSAEEEQSYDDILCAIQLLIQLGTKDFIDFGNDTSTSTSSSSSGAMSSNQVTEMIFFGLQQMLPLMTRGLLQYPTLCTQYFSLVGFMMETYPDKAGILPLDLFDALLESLLFGMSHHDTMVAKCSLQGLAGIFKEHLQHRILDVHLAQSNGELLLDKCSHRLLMEVVFQNCVWDRIEATGSAFLPLAAVDLNRFAAVVQGISQQVPAEHQPRLSGAFEQLLQPEVLAKVLARGYEGRQNRIRFRKDFEHFCHEVHSFLVLK